LVDDALPNQIPTTLYTHQCINVLFDNVTSFTQGCTYARKQGCIHPHIHTHLHTKINTETVREIVMEMGIMGEKMESNGKGVIVGEGKGEKEGIHRDGNRERYT